VCYALLCCYFAVLRALPRILLICLRIQRSRKETWAACACTCAGFDFAVQLSPHAHALVSLGHRHRLRCYVVDLIEVHDGGGYDTRPSYMSLFLRIKHTQKPFIPTPTQSPNSKLIDSPLCVRRILSAMVALISNVTNLVQPFWCSRCGTVFVTYV
jgi:hypothetical protein